MKALEKRACIRSIILLICLLAVSNVSQGVVLCIGSDGHIALETAFHERCHHPVHSQQPDMRQVAEETDSHPEGKHCQPCIDLPVSIGLTNDRLPLSRVEPSSQVSTPFVESPVVCSGTFIPAGVLESLCFSTAYFAPLRTIVLLV